MTDIMSLEWPINGWTEAQALEDIVDIIGEEWCDTPTFSRTTLARQYAMLNPPPKPEISRVLWAIDKASEYVATPDLWTGLQAWGREVARLALGLALDGSEDHTVIGAPTSRNF